MLRLSFADCGTISIHALREEGDTSRKKGVIIRILFLSTPSARRATKTVADRHKALEISIHALREEGDAAYLLRLAESRYFYPRPPRGGRLLLPLTAARSSIFLSTPSARRATQQAGGAGNGPSNFYPRPPRGGRLDVLLRAAAHSSISIHALREEGDRYGSSFKPAFVRFLSTPSARRATTEVGVHALAKGISIHALREEGDTPDAAFRSPVPVFLSTPSARRATLRSGAQLIYQPISIHALREEGDINAR